eukprot:gene197-237_t
MNIPSKSQWLKRQLSDPYVKQAQIHGYVSRAAFKLEEIDTQYKILKEGRVVVDLGATPGGWTQVAERRVGATGTVISVDINEAGYELVYDNFIGGDFRTKETKDAIKAMLRARRASRTRKELPADPEDVRGFVDVVISDMAPSYCGMSAVDHTRLIELAGHALDFALETLRPDGSFVCKVSRGGTENELLKRIQENFQTVRSFKPDASRQESSEIYYIGIRFKATSSTISKSSTSLRRESQGFWEKVSTAHISHHPP